MDQGLKVNLVLQNPRELDWQSQGLCRETDPDAFFPDPRDRAYAAKAICGGCPVRGKCLKYSFDNNEPYGVWGGVSPDERKHFKRLNLPLDDEGVDRWMAYRNIKRKARRETYKEINNKYS
jgi:WhiB family redox-sensing transcriptional regulator